MVDGNRCQSRIGQIMFSKEFFENETVMFCFYYHGVFIFLFACLCSQYVSIVPNQLHTCFCSVLLFYLILSFLSSGFRIISVICGCVLLSLSVDI